MSLVKGLFALFPKRKKCEVWPAGGFGAGGRDVSSSTPAAYAQGTLAAHPATPVSRWIADNGDTWKMVHSALVGTYWVNQVTHDSQWRPPWEHKPGQGPPPAQGGI